MVSKTWYCYVCGDTCEFRQTIRQSGVFAKNLVRCPSGTGGQEARWFDTRAKAEKDFYSYVIPHQRELEERYRQEHAGTGQPFPCPSLHTEGVPARASLGGAAEPRPLNLLQMGLT